MYADVALIRTHEIKVRLNDKEAALIKAFADYTGGQKAVLVRELILNSITEQMQNTEQSNEQQK